MIGGTGGINSGNTVFPTGAAGGEEKRAPSGNTLTLNTTLV